MQHANVLGTYIHDHHDVFKRICQVTTRTAYVMLVESSLSGIEEMAGDAPWVTPEFENAVGNKNYILLDIGDRAMVLYSHDRRWFLYNASRGALAHHIARESRKYHQLSWPHLQAAQELLDMADTNEESRSPQRYYAPLMDLSARML